MKCKNCNNDVKTTMKYCPYCSYNLTNQIIKFKILEKIIVFLLTIVFFIGILVIIEFINDLKNNQTVEKQDHLEDMVASICNGKYDTIYTNDNFDNQGIYQSKQNHYVYYVKDLQTNLHTNNYGQLYEIGYTYHDDVEKLFPNSIYLYRDSHVSSIASELKIAVVANSEEELIKNYSKKFYQFVKNLNKTYKKDIQLIIYFNNSLSGINTTYDKLFLMAGYNTNNVTQSDGMGSGYGEYILYDGDPYDLLDTIFSDKNKYPTNARNALKNNRHINLTIKNGETITFDEFVEKFKNSFNDTL